MMLQTVLEYDGARDLEGFLTYLAKHVSVLSDD